MLRYIVDTYGIEVYKNTSLLLAYVSDLAPRLENEKRLLKICAESGIVTQFAENSNIVTDEQEIFVKKSETTLCNQYFFNENAARNVLSWLVYSVDWAYKPQEETSNKPRNVSEHKYESIPQKATTLTSCKKKWVVSSDVDRTVASTDDNEKNRPVGATGNNESIRLDTNKKKKIIAISCGEHHTVGLREDGTVVATGWNGHKECNVSSWRDIIAISCGEEHTVGLRKDGTVVAAGDNHWRQCNISSWRDIIAIFCGTYHTVGLKKDGTVVAAGENIEKKCDVSSWRDIIAVSSDNSHTIGLKKDGTVVATGHNKEKQCKVSRWKDIVAVSSSFYLTAGFKKDGTVVVAGKSEHGKCDVSDWENITAVYCSGACTVGLRKDGTVVVSGITYTGYSNEIIEYDVSDWKDIVTIFCSNCHIVGLKKTEQLWQPVIIDLDNAMFQNGTICDGG